MIGLLTIRNVALLLCSVAISVGTPLGAQQQKTLDEGVSQIAESLGGALLGKTVAIFEFPDLEGRISNLSRLVSEHLTTEMVRRLGRAGTVVERRQVIQVLEELNLQKTDLSATDVSRVGRQLGADAIVLGSTAVLGDQIVINARAITVAGGRVVGAERMSVRGSPELLALAGDGLDGPSLIRKTPARSGNSESPRHGQAPAPRITSTFGPVTAELTGCFRRSRTITCDLLLNNTAEDTEYRLLYSLGRMGPQFTRIFDGSGNEYNVGLLRFGRQQGLDEVWGMLLTGVPTRAAVVLYAVPESVTRIELLEVCIGDADRFGALQFRKVPITAS